MTGFRSSLFSPLFLALLLIAPLAALAETAPADAEEQIDKGLKDFGYQAGLSRGCVANEQAGDLEREVLDLHGDLGRLLGTDRAFLFAAAFGYGSSVLTPVEECKAVLEGFEARVKSFRSEAGVRP
ncbi:MAG: hypothetical protein WBM84_01000 [Sedimenticolaceae bacterium]